MSYLYDYPRPAVTTDVVLLTSTVTAKVLLIKRGKDPFAGQWALPGGFVDMDEDLPDAALRELEEETGVRDIKIKQLGAYGSVNRDPRHRTISVVYYGFVDKEVSVQGMDDAADAGWFAIDKLPELAFDHSQILNDAFEYLKLK